MEEGVEVRGVPVIRLAGYLAGRIKNCWNKLYEKYKINIKYIYIFKNNSIFII